MKTRKLITIVLTIVMVCAITAQSALIVSGAGLTDPSDYWIGGYAPLPSAPQPAERTKWANISWAPSGGDGSAGDPYIVDGAVFGSGQLSWPQWNYLMGYAYGGGGQAYDPDPYPTYLPIVVVFEWRSGANLLYSWKIDGSGPQTPIVFNSAGPIRLQVTQTYDSAAKVTSFSFIFYELHLGDVPYDFAGYYPELTLNVGSHYADGTELNVSGPGADTTKAIVNGGAVTIGVNVGGD